jgi:hypothetical protein
MNFVIRRTEFHGSGKAPFTRDDTVETWLSDYSPLPLVDRCTSRQTTRQTKKWEQGSMFGCIDRISTE